MKQFCILLGIVAVISASGRRAFKRGDPVTDPVADPGCIGTEIEMDTSSPTSKITSICEVEYEVIQKRIPQGTEDDDEEDEAAYLIRKCTPESPRYIKLTDKGGLIDGEGKGSSTYMQCGVPEDYDTYTKNGFSCSKSCTYLGAEARAEAQAKLRRQNEVGKLKGQRMVTSRMKRFGG